MASHPPRLEDFPYTGRHHYFLTFCTRHRRPYFREAAAVLMLREQILRFSREFRFAVHAYLAMPDHVHLLTQGLGDGSDLARFMGRFKQATGWLYRRDWGRPLWQGSYYDHIVREQEGISGVVAYIVNNPVRAGLVERPEDYPFWDSFTQGRDGILACLDGTGEWKPPYKVEESGHALTSVWSGLKP